MERESFFKNPDFVIVGKFLNFASIRLIKPGDIAQLARAAALQAVGQGFESPYLQKKVLNGLLIELMFVVNE